MQYICKWNTIQPKKNEILSFVRTQIKLKIFMLSEKAREKDTYHMISLMYVIFFKPDIMEVDNRMLLLEAGETEGWEEIYSWVLSDR